MKSGITNQLPKASARSPQSDSPLIGNDQITTINPTQLQVIRVPADGNCFYYAICLDLLKAALNKQISEQSATAKAIKTNLLPLIYRAVTNKNRTPKRLETLPLHRSVRRLLSMAIYKYYGDTPKEFSLEELLRELVPQKNIFINTLVPALRQVMVRHFTDTDILEERIKHSFKRMFTAYGYVTCNISTPADPYFKIFEDQKKESELTNYEKSLAPLYVDSFNQVKQSTSDFARICDSKTSADIKMDFLNEKVFEHFWEKHAQTVIETYKKQHLSNWTWAEEPQRYALSRALHFQLGQYSVGRVDPGKDEQLKGCVGYIHPFEETSGAHTFYTKLVMSRNQQHHFEAIPFPQHTCERLSAKKFNISYADQPSEKRNASKQHSAQVSAAKSNMLTQVTHTVKDKINTSVQKVKELMTPKATALPIAETKIPTPRSSTTEMMISTVADVQKLINKRFANDDAIKQSNLKTYEKDLLLEANRGYVRLFREARSPEEKAHLQEAIRLQNEELISYLK